MRKLCVAAALLASVVAPLQGQERARDGWIELFNGKDLSGWHLRKPDSPNGWKILEGAVYENTKPSTDLVTDREDFYDFQLHVEFMILPGTNSGVYMRDKYEIQIFDSYGNPAAANGCGALYQRTPPSENACGPAGEWQSFDVTLIGRRLTVVHNGKMIHDGVDVGPKGTGGSKDRDDGPGPLRLQGDHGSLLFRNVRIRPL